MNEEGELSFICAGTWVNDAQFQGESDCLSQASSDESITADPLFVCIGESNLELCSLEEMARVTDVDISFELDPLDQSSISYALIDLETHAQ